MSGRSDQIVAALGDNLWVLTGGSGPDGKENATDFAEHLRNLRQGRLPDKPLISEHQAFGDAYGFLAPRMLSQMLPDDDTGLRDTAVDNIGSVFFHADTHHDVGLSINTRTKPDAPAPEQVDQLAGMLGSALTLGRMGAQARGEDELSEFLSNMRIRKKGGQGFDLEMALPLESWVSFLDEKCR